MSIIINGTTGISGVDGTAGTPSLQGNDTNTGIVFGTDTVGVSTGGVQRTTVDSSGRLLVGTASGSHPLSVVSSQSSKIQFGQASDQGGFLFCDGPGAFGIAGGGYYNGANWIAKHTASSHIRDDGDGNIKFHIDTSLTVGSTFTPTERMRVDSAGRTMFSKPFDSSSKGCQIIPDDGNTGRFHAVGDGSGTGAAFFVSNASAATQYIVRPNGNVLNVNNSYGAISDVKLKENIVDATSQWSDIKALQVRKYNFKEGQTHTQIGLVAQEVELISPGLVSESPDHGPEGNDLGTVTKSVNYSVLYMKAVKALQEAMERIETLEAAVTALQQS